MPASKTASPVLGIDLGGSKILALVLDGKGRVLARAKQRTKPKKGYDKVLQRIRETADMALQEAGYELDDMQALGLGLPGPVLPEQGEILGAVNLGWERKAIVKDLIKLFGDRPIAIGNDVNFGGLGEATYGIAAGTTSSYALFMGTGLGGALVIDGRLQVGSHGFAGEIGHLPGPFDNALCTCGQHGCLETVASKMGIARLLRQAREAGAACVLDEEAIDDLRSSHLRMAWDADCTTTHKVLSQAADALAWGINLAALACDPEVVVLGGGVMEELGEELLPIIKQSLQAYHYRSQRFAVDIRLACLAGDAVAIGAAVAAREEAAHA